MRQSKFRSLLTATIVAVLFTLPFSTRAQAPTKIHELPVSAEIEGKNLLGRAFIINPGSKARLTPMMPEAETAVESFQPIEIESPQVVQMQIAWNVRWKIPGGKVHWLSESEIEWQAPDRPGNYQLELILTHTRDFDRSSSDIAGQLSPKQATNYISRFTMLNTYPFDPEGNGTINGYPVGVYPNENADNVKPYIAARRDRYRPPRRFIQVSPEVMNLQLSPYFRVGQFVTAPSTQRDVYIALDHRLLERLDEIVRELRREGHRVRTLEIFRGYISPLETQRLRREGGQFTQFTRHQYGDSAAFFVDADGDGRMDDLNRDGKVDIGDCEYLEEIVTKLEKDSGKYGGMGLFAGRVDPTTPDTPWVEIDMRGNRERW